MVRNSAPVPKSDTPAAPPDPGDAAVRAASAIRSGFVAYWTRFRDITRRAPANFESADWDRAQTDARERLDLYADAVSDLVSALQEILGPRLHHVTTWARIKAAYAESISGLPADEIAETFFNSVTRRVLTTVGINADVEFVDFTFGRMTSGLGGTPFRSYAAWDDPGELVERILRDSPFSDRFGDRQADAARAGDAIQAAWDRGGAPVPFESVEVLGSVFYRRKGAYVVARVRGGHRVMPLVLALGSRDGSIFLDATLTEERDVSVVFSFTHSYFHVDVDRPTDVIDFLRSIMPVKPVAELYAGLGYHKHGKTELYRHLRRHLTHSDDKFEAAPGVPGMVMVVFVMPGFDVVFKVIRDSFPHPKRTTPEDVRRRYRLVFQHDRAGRLIDAQSFEQLEFARARFTPELLDELQRTASQSVTITDDCVAFEHLYTERRVKPLDIFLEEADRASRRRAVLDYGQAIEDLAATGVFPGDLLLKNFGVTRQGRVVFYDYDELCLLDDCRFRRIPEARTPEDEMAAEPWFHVGPNDIFPEEFVRFLGIPPEEKDLFMDEHGRIFDPAFWQSVQSRRASGDMVDIFPYAAPTSRPPTQ